MTAHNRPVLLTAARILGGEPQDVLLADGVIAKVAPAGSLEAPEGALVIDATDKVLLPGLVLGAVRAEGPLAWLAVAVAVFLIVFHGWTWWTRRPRRLQG